VQLGHLLDHFDAAAELRLDGEVRVHAGELLIDLAKRSRQRPRAENRQRDLRRRGGS